MTARSTLTRIRLRTSDPEDVWAFAKGCMRTYLILKEKAAQFNADAEIQAIVEQIDAARCGAGPDFGRRVQRRRTRRP